jgi:hypothetical protein
VIAPALLFHLLMALPSGTDLCFHDKCGYFFWGAHGHDGIWHLAIDSTAFKSFPFVAPTFAGAMLNGYNYLLDLVIFAFSKIGIPPLITYFKLFPLVWFVLFTAVAIHFARKLHDSPLFVSIFLFFCYFASSFSYIITLLHNKTIMGSSGVLAMQSGQSLINIQFAFSLIIILAILTLIRESEITTRKAVILGILAFICLGLKFYGGFVSMVLIGTYLLFSLIHTKKFGKVLLSAFIIGLFAASAMILFYDPFHSSQTGSVLGFAPFAVIHPIIEDPQLLYMKDTVNARYFLQAGGIGFKLIRIEIMTFLIFFLMNFGTRVVGFGYLILALVQKKIKRLDVFIIIAMIAATAMTSLFVQKGEWWNTIQFFYYTLFLGNIFAAQALFQTIRKHRTIGYITLVIVILLTLPANIDLVSGFSSFPSPSYLSRDEREALQKLATLPKGVVLHRLFSSDIKYKGGTPIPLYAYDDTAYVSAFSGQQEYIGDQVQLRLTGIPYEARLKKYMNHDCSVLTEVNYLYDVKQRPIAPNYKACSQKLKEIYSNKSSVIYSIIK